MKLKKYLKQQGYKSINLTTLPSGHHVVKAKINGTKGIFILDTGASTTCINQDKIDQFKLKAKDTEQKATGAGTTEIDVQLAKKNKITIGAWKVKKTPVVIMDLTHINTALSMFDIKIDGIIGSDILHKGKGIIEYEKERLFLKLEHRN